MKEKEFDDLISSLGKTEQSFIKEKYYAEIKRWAILIDEINGYGDSLVNFPESFHNDLTTDIGDFNTVIDQIRALNISEDPAGPEHVKNRYTNFRNSTYLRLLNKKSILETATLKVSDLESLKKVTADAKKQAENFRKSFEESLQKQSSGSTRTLAKHFDTRLKNLKNTDETNPNKWLKKRHFWGWVLGLTLVAIAVLYIAGASYHWFKGFELQVAAIKLGALVLIYSQYHFSTKNYHIYADLVAQYEHMAVISKTITDFIASAYDDDLLKESILGSASKTLFSDINTGHSKGDNGDSPVLENIINSWPKNTSG